mgnify:CR=1 FL=1
MEEGAFCFAHGVEGVEGVCDGGREERSDGVWGEHLIGGLEDAGRFQEGFDGEVIGQSEMVAEGFCGGDDASCCGEIDHCISECVGGGSDLQGDVDAPS